MASDRASETQRLLSEEKSNQSSEAKEIKYLTDISKAGKRLGRGSFGIVRKIGDLVYKMYIENYFRDVLPPSKSGIKTDIRLAARSARYWNMVFDKIHNGKYKHLATARVITVINDVNEDGKKPFVDILITPFINGTPVVDMEWDVWIPHICSFNFKWLPYSSQRREVIAELNKLGLGMWDVFSPDNIFKMPSGDLIPIDFDAFYELPVCANTVSPAYYRTTPPSPGTRFWANRDFAHIRESKEKKQDKDPDELGLRSMLMRT